MTPQERFDSSGKKIAGQAGRKAGCSSLSAKSRVSTASIVKQLRSKARRRTARCIANRARLAVRATPPNRDGEKKKRNY
ncbi:hypothetical protein ACET3Z_020917 [Daucus carota]